MKKFDICLIFSQNIGTEAVLTNTHNLCFEEKMYTPVNPSFTI